MSVAKRPFLYPDNFKKSCNSLLSIFYRSPTSVNILLSNAIDDDWSLSTIEITEFILRPENSKIIPEVMNGPY